MIRRISLLGLGTMGPGIAARLACGGVSVRVYDTSEIAIERAKGLIDSAFTVLNKLSIKPSDNKESVIQFSTSLAECIEETDLIIENIPEDIEAKAGLYRKLDPIIDQSTIVASNTSGIQITQLQAFISNPERFIGMHWSNPPHIIPMIEVVAGKETNIETVERVRDFIKLLNLLPVVVKKDVPGFVENRVLYAMMREVVDLVERGVIDAEDVDTCVSWGIGFKIAVIGPMALLDMAGLDIYKSVSSFLNKDLSNKEDVASIILDKVNNKNLGIKSTKGIYNYTNEKIIELKKERENKLVLIRRILENKI